MPSLQVRELPEQIYNKLKVEAQKEHRSFAQQAIITLAKGLGISDKPVKRRVEILKYIKEDPILSSIKNVPDPIDFIREDRER